MIGERFIMLTQHRVRAFAVATAVVSLLGACASSAVPTTSPQPTPSAVASPTSPPATAASPSSGASAPPPSAPAVTVTRDVTYGATGASTEPNKLDVYAPTKLGPWPVVVMFHGGGVSKSSYGAQASHVAADGSVVFVPNWAPAGPGVPTPAQFKAYESEGACAVAFARSHAAEYGGDTNTLILFGHSAGANLAGGIAFTRPSPTPGCPGGASLGPIHALVTWDGDWSMTDPSWDATLRADSASWTTFTPVTHIASDRTLKVVMLTSGVVGGYARNLSDQAAADAFFGLRDPSGLLHQQVEAIGALDDGSFDIQEIQQLLFTLLEAQGNPVTLTELPGTSHDSFGGAMNDEAMAVFVAAFKAAAGA